MSRDDFSLVGISIGLKYHMSTRAGARRACAS